MNNRVSMGSPFDRKGVSPVIATILIVAMTVVMSAVLYMMVWSFNFEVGRTPTTDIISTEQTLDGEVIFMFGPSIPPVNFADCYLHVSLTPMLTELYTFEETTDSYYTNSDDDPTLAPNDGNDCIGALGVIIKVTDLGGEGMVSNGDSVIFENLSDGMEIHIGLVEKYSGDTIASGNFEYRVR
jgi:flagellin-like protein